MDFGSLLHAAKLNENSVKEVKCYKSTFEPPKKEQKTKALSANIQKFLARKEEEERKKAIEAKKKKDELLALRSQDVKAKKRVAAMLKRTKAANKAAIEDAVDNENTAVTLGGLAQPDEDDYGYVSQEASAYYNKLMEKYTATPSEEPKFSKKSLLKSSAADLNNTKDRVRMALLREEEEEMMPHKRKRKTKEEKLAAAESGNKSHSQSDYGETNESEEEKPEKLEPPAKVCRPPPPSPMNFSELLKIAEKKQFEPIKIAPKPKEEDEDVRPLTKKQRIEYMKEKEWRMRKEGKLPPLTASEQLRGQDQRNNRSRYSEERSRDQKHIHPAADSNSNRKYNCPSADKNRDKRNGQLFVDEQREQVGGSTSMYGNKDQMSGRYADQRIGQSSGEIRDQRNSRPSEGSRNLKNDRSSGDSNSSIPRIPKVTSIRKDEKSQHRIPKCNDINSSNNRSVKLKGNSDGKVCKERNKDVTGKLPVKSNHASLSSASGHGSANRNSVEQRKGMSNTNNNNNSKNFNLSGYSKKLQESLLAKLQEKEKSDELPEAKKLCVPGAQNSKPPKNHDSGSFDLVRGPKPQPKAARSSDSKDTSRESSVGKQSVKPSTFPQGLNRTLPGALSSKSQFPVRSKSGHQIPPRDVKDIKMNRVTSNDVNHRQFPPPEVKPQQVQPGGKPRQFAPPNIKSQQFPLQGVKPRQFPPADVRMKPKPVPKRRIEDSDEHDSELEDFIDDGSDDTEDYSQHIKEIFGYDKSRYKDMDGDDECMESSFSQQLKEEFVSTKMGILEDLEDMEMEKRELAKKKKLMVMKKNRRL